jgi:hypothetical protein
MARKQMIYEFLRKMKNLHGMEAIYTTEEIASAVGASRANASFDLNRLFEEELVEKIPGWPVRYRASAAVLTPLPDITPGVSVEGADSVFEQFIGFNGSMSMEIEKAKAAVLYPLSGLPMLIGGKTGVGKTTFAKLMYEYAKKTGRLKTDARFVTFNCADLSVNEPSPLPPTPAIVSEEGEVYDTLPPPDTLLVYQTNATTPTTPASNTAGCRPAKRLTPSPTSAIS